MSEKLSDIIADLAKATSELTILERMSRSATSEATGFRAEIKSHRARLDLWEHENIKGLPANKCGSVEIRKSGNLTCIKDYGHPGFCSAVGGASWKRSA